MNAGTLQPATSQTGQQSTSTYDPFASLGNSGPTSKPGTPAPYQQPQMPSSLRPAGIPVPTSVSPFQRQGSPFQFQQATMPVSTVPAPGGVIAQPSASSSLSYPTNGGAVEDEWTFTSALPHQSYKISVTRSGVATTFHVARMAGADNVLLIHSTMSNNTSYPITNLTFQLAVTKVGTAKA